MIKGQAMTDSEKICFLEKQCFSDPWSLNSIETQLSGKQAVWIIHEEKGKPVGYALGTIVCGEAELYRIAVVKEYRRNGLGERLMNSFLEECKKRDSEKVFLEVRSRNAPAIALYEKSGFQQISVRKHYYDDDDAVIFAKNL